MRLQESNESMGRQAQVEHFLDLTEQLDELTREVQEIRYHLRDTQGAEAQQHQEQLQDIRSLLRRIVNVLDHE